MVLREVPPREVREGSPMLLQPHSGTHELHRKWETPVGNPRVYQLDIQNVPHDSSISPVLRLEPYYISGRWFLNCALSVPFIFSAIQALLLSWDIPKLLSALPTPVNLLPKEIEQVGVTLGLM